MLAAKHEGIMPKYGQWEYMRILVKKLGRNKKAVCDAYAKAEREDLVIRKYNTTHKSPEEYALALWNNGYKKGWFYV
jgi:hypothetical protein